MSTKMLEELTLDSAKAKSIAHHLRMGDKSHFNPNVTKFKRLADLGEQLRLVFIAAVVEREAGTDAVELQHNLLDLAAIALIWAEVLDKHARTPMPVPGGVAAYYTEDGMPQ